MSEFRSMGCEVVHSGAPNEAVAELFEQRDACFSRFCVGSELNRVNARPAGVAFLSEEFATMLGLALEAARVTDGIVTPTLGAALVAAGYDRDFDELTESEELAVATAVPSIDALSLRGRLLVRVAPIQLDLNGVVKSKTVDDSLALIGEGWISAGGDLATAVPVNVGLPGGDVVILRRGGLATSSTRRRCWQRGGERQHHLIEPATGRPAQTRWQDVTAVAGSCVAADVAAKAALLLDDRGPAWLDQRGLPGRFLDLDGDVHVNAAWSRAQRRALAAA
jgi:thiamine biosynthesis lipoprotein